MPKIKDKQKLVRRAKDHYDADTVIRGSGYNKVLGDLVTGCAIGCLATPVTAKGASKLDSIKDLWKSITGNYDWNDDEVDQQEEIVRLMKKDFGIAPLLTLLAEACFESWECFEDEDENLYTWPWRFAKALPEGVKITNKEIGKFLVDNEIEYSYYRDNPEEWWVSGNMPKDTDERLISWLREKAK